MGFRRRLGLGQRKGEEDIAEKGKGTWCRGGRENQKGEGGVEQKKHLEAPTSI